MPEVASGQLLHLRLFLEGVEVPVISATVTAAIGSPAAAQIEIVPTDLALNLLPRTTVHVFYFDYEDAKYDPSPLPTFSDIEASILPDPDVVSLRKPLEKYYKLLFCGELFSLSYTKSGFGQRSVVLQCLDFSNMWDTNYMYQLRWSSVADNDGQGSAVVANQSIFLGSNYEGLDDIINYPANVVSDLMNARKVANNPGLQGTRNIIGSLFSVLEVLGGVHGKWFGVNSWTTVQERRVRLMDQLIGDSGETATKLFEQSVFEQWLLQRLGGSGAVISFRDLIRIINSYVYYEVIPNPVARYIPGDNGIPNWELVDATLKQQGLIGESITAQVADPELVAAETGAIQRSTGRDKLNPWFLDRLNKMEEDMVQSRGWNGTRKPLPRETSLFRASSTYKHGVGHAADLSVNGLPTGFDSRKLAADAYDDINVAKKTFYGRVHYHQKFGGVDSPLLESDIDRASTYQLFFKDLAAAAGAQGLRSGNSFGIGTDTNALGTEYNKARSYGKVFHEYTWHSIGLGWDPVHVESPFSMKDIRAGRIPSLEVTKEGTEEPTTNKEEGVKRTATPASLDVDPGQPIPEREKLVTQVFRPDVWFVPPPKCNVVFPQEYSTLTFTRQMLREVTRLQLTTFEYLYEDAIVNQYYFAPQLLGDKSLTEGGIGSAAKALIYKHERFTGIVPKMERISEISFYSKLNTEQFGALDIRVSKDTRLVDVDSIDNDVTNLIEKYAAQVAAYNFLTQRYASRTGNVAGRFMPRVVCGFPMLVINRPETAGLEALHFLGLVVSISHTLSQGGGNTSVSLTHVRSHKQESQTDDLFAEGVKLELQFDDKVDQEVATFYSADGTSLQAPGKAEAYLWLSRAENWQKNEDRAREFQRQTALVEAGILIEVEPDVASSEGLPTLNNPPPPEVMVGPNNSELVRLVVPQFAGAEEETFLTPDQIAGEILEQAGLIEKQTTTPTEPTLDYFFDQSGNVVAKRFEVRNVTVIEKISGSNQIPLEEAIRPPWFSDEYSNERIGRDIYQPFFGCGSIIDVPVDADENYQLLSIEAATRALSSDYTKYASTETAESYIHSFTQREHASLPDVLNSFHREAYGNKTGLAGLDIVGVNLTLPSGEAEQQELGPDEARDLDPRKPRRDRVLAYRAELLNSLGLRG